MNLPNIEYQSHILPNNNNNILHAVHSYDINVLQENYSVILRIYKWGYLGGGEGGSFRFQEKVMSHYIHTI